MLRDLPYRDNSYCGLENEIPIAISPTRSSPIGRESFVSIQPIMKRKMENIDEDGHIQFKIPRTGLSDLFQFTHLNEDAELRYIVLYGQQYFLAFSSLFQRYLYVTIYLMHYNTQRTNI